MIRDTVILWSPNFPFIVSITRVNIRKNLDFGFGKSGAVARKGLELWLGKVTSCGSERSRALAWKSIELWLGRVSGFGPETSCSSVQKHLELWLGQVLIVRHEGSRAVARKINELRLRIKPKTKNLNNK